jgi:SM-20-related protein
MPEDRQETTEIMQWLQMVADFLNRRFMLGLVDFETHFARYDSGTHYDRHMDNGRNTNRRVISLIIYLNHEWRHQWGGQLVIHNKTPHMIDPDPGRGVAFLSDQVEHEVLATSKPRWSLTCWFLRRE